MLGSLWGHFGITQKIFSKYFQIFSALFLMIPSPSPSFSHPHHAKKWHDFALITPYHATLVIKSALTNTWHRLFCWFTKPSLSSTTAERFRFLTKCFDNVLGNPYKISVCQILRLVFQNLSAVALLGPHVAGIRDGDNPIGRAQPKN